LEKEIQKRKIKELNLKRAKKKGRKIGWGLGPTITPSPLPAFFVFHGLSSLKPGKLKRVTRIRDMNPTFYFETFLIKNLNLPEG
jgi:hypothetical protein